MQNRTLFFTCRMNSPGGCLSSKSRKNASANKRYLSERDLHEPGDWFSVRSGRMLVLAQCARHSVTFSQDRNTGAQNFSVSSPGASGAGAAGAAVCARPPEGVRGRSHAPPGGRRARTAAPLPEVPGHVMSLSASTQSDSRLRTNCLKFC